MDILTLLFIAVGLSMDAFAVSVSSGMILCHTKMRRVLKIAASFGLFQGLMPLIGYTIARTFADKIEAVDHWIAPSSCWPSWAGRCCGRRCGAARRNVPTAIPVPGRTFW